MTGTNETMNRETEPRTEWVPAAAGLAPPAGRSFGAAVFAGIGPRIMLAPEGADGGTGGSDTPAAGADISDPGAGSDAARSSENAPPTRPDYIPESFWDAEKGFKGEDFNALIARDAERAAALAQVPDAADKYEAKLPQNFKLPDGVELADGESPFDPADPRIEAAREFALANQFSQAQFEELIAFGVHLDAAEQARLKEGLGQQRELLGAKGKERVSAVTNWLGAKIGGELADALTPMMFTAKSIQAFEALMRLNRGDVRGNPGAGRDSGTTEISDEDYAKMSPSEKINYARQASKKK